MIGNVVGDGDSKVTIRRKSKMAASTVVTVTEQNTSLIIDELLSQDEKDDIKRMLEDEHKIHKPEPAPIGEPKKGEAKPGNTKPPGERCMKKGMEKILKDASLDDLNDVLGRVGERFDELERSMEDLQLSLEFSQNEIDDLKKENLKLKQEVKKLRKVDHRNE